MFFRTTIGVADKGTAARYEPVMVADRAAENAMRSLIKANFPERYNSGPDAILNPDHIAETYWQLHRQPRSAWTFEMDLRPWKETW